MSIDVTRRNALSGAAAVGLGVPLLAACGSDKADVTATTTTPRSGEMVGSTSDVAVGACAVFADQKLVVTQPTEGEFKCFSSVCTHQGCQVSSSPEGVIPCRCHGSAFSLVDGSVVEGPATKPLPEVAITVSGDSISIT